MSEQTSPAINLISDFKVGSSKGESYKKFINYISTEKNKKNVKKPDIENNLFDKYLDYMSVDKLKKKQGYNKENVKKRTTMSFNSEHEFIEEKEMIRLKNKFQEANKKNHVMYQDVVSFDNQFLKDNHLFNESLDKLDEPKIKKATRRMINQMIKDNKMDKNNTFWCANIHYDTDNIHIHIATSEEKNTRTTIKEGKFKGQYKGKRTSKTIRNMKSTFANSINQDIGLMKEFDELKREMKDNVKEKIKNKKYHSYSIKSILKQKKDLDDLVEKLPPLNETWSYNSKKIKPIQSEIDQYIDNYISQFYSESEKRVDEILDQQASNYKRLYGENSKYNDYKKNKKDRLKSDVGNAFLKELKAIEKEKQERKGKLQQPREKPYNKNIKQMNNRERQKSVRNFKQAITGIRQSLYQLSRNTARKRNSYIHDIERQKLERNIERNLKEQEDHMSI